MAKSREDFFQGDREFIDTHIEESVEILNKINKKSISDMVEIISECQSSAGRIFFLGVGGSAGNCSHAVNDFRKILGIESYAATDNVSELTARVNDDGWETVFEEFLKTSKLKTNDVVFVFSVGGGSEEKNISVNIVNALNFAKKRKCKIIGVVGRDGGHTKKVGDSVVLIPIVNENSITPHTEAFHAIIWHLLVSHPKLKMKNTKWESTK